MKDSDLNQDQQPPMHQEKPDDDDPLGTLAVNADNGFNELMRKAMLWFVRHLWPTPEKDGGDSGGI
jgi:hypothetical protein